jgi:hypothetical protein
MKGIAMKKGEIATMELLFTNIIIAELVALQYLIIVFLFLLACPACPKKKHEKQQEYAHHICTMKGRPGTKGHSSTWASQ